MAERVAIVAAPRTVLGKQVKHLRQAGQLPANVYGRGIASRAIQLDAREFGRLTRRTGFRNMFELRVDGESDARHVIIRGLVRQGGTGDPAHVDFYQVDLTKPITATVTVHIVGVAPAVRDLAGTLLQSLEHVTVRCLPLAIPDVLEADAGLLKSFDVSLTVADLHAPEGVTILGDPSITVASVTAPRLRIEGEPEEQPEVAES